MFVRSGARPVLAAGNSPPSVRKLSRQSGTLESHNPIGFHGLLGGGELNSCTVFSHGVHSATPHILLGRRVEGREQESQTKNQLRGPLSASQLYRLSDRYLSVKFSANFYG
jgi:hypothetical protein